MNKQDILTLMDGGFWDEALKETAELPEISADTWFLRSKIYSRLGRMADSLSCLNKTLDIDPNHEEAKVMVELSQSIYAFRDPNRYNP